MESILGIVQSPIFLGLLIFLGLACVIRILLAREPDLKRTYRDDRRKHKAKMPATPFEDSEGQLVTRDRRVQADRRRSQLLAMQHQMDEDHITG